MIRLMFLLELGAEWLRFINIGKINTKIYAVVTTYRKENIRIISARRSRKKEIEIYES